MPEQYFNCTTCGAPINEDNNGEFCKFCGTKLPKEETAPATNITNTYNVTNIIYKEDKKESAKPAQDSNEERLKKIAAKEKKKNAIKALFVAIIGVAIIIIGLNTPIKVFMAVIGGFMIINALGILLRTDTCRRCKNKIGYTVKVCPYCNYNQQSLPMWLIALILVLGAVVVFIIFTQMV
ncbi:MAG: hypothetical protein ACI4KR_10280 [Ruminiclostridium sp.]